MVQMADWRFAKSPMVRMSLSMMTPHSKSSVELCSVVWPHSQQLRSDLEEIAASSGYPYSVSPWARLLSDRKSGWHQLGGVPKI
jgi:hypothetical protein